MKRILCALLALMMLVGVFTGCASKKQTTTEAPATSELDEETKKLYETVVLTLDGEEITYEKYRYYYHIGLSAYRETNREELGETAVEEINELVLNELKSEYAIRKLAKELGVEPSEEDIESVDAYIDSQKYYAALEGTTYEKILAKNYCTVEVFRDWMIYYYFIENGVYEKLYDEENTTIDRSDDAIRKHLEGYHATLHILLTTKNYSGEENILKLGEKLKKLLNKADALAESITAETTNAEAAEKLGEFLADYNTDKNELSYVGSFSGYTEKLTALKTQLTAEDAKPAISYLQSAAKALTATDDATKAVKALASYLAADGFDDESKESIEKAYTDYAAYIEKKKLEYFGVSDDEDFDISNASYPTGKEYDALFALELVKAVYQEQKEEESGVLTALADAILEDAFSYAVLIFGEDRQDHENGVYFKKGEVDESFEEAYFALDENEISGTVKSEYGYHIIKRIPTDFDYYKDLLYQEYAVTDFLADAATKVTAELTDLYHTVKPDTLK